MRVSDWIVQELIRRGVTTLFTLQGGFSQHLNDSIGHSDLKPAYMLTESGASYAAYGHALCTGQMGVLCVTSGLAQTNAISGVASAFSDYVPMFVISGDIATDLIVKREEEELRQGGQQDVKIDRIAEAVTKKVVTVMTAHSAQVWLDILWKLALAEPQGACWLNIPIDIQQAEALE
jgi:acetolactate synthase-1/2/3 large subunit